MREIRQNQKARSNS